MKTWCFDLDNTICETNVNDYENSVPKYEIINRINFLYSNGNYIKIFTARGMGSLRGNVELVYQKYFDFTKDQLTKWGVNFNELILAKPSFDFVIDDKNMSIDDLKKNINPKIGLVAGSFDLLHPGYISLFEECKNSCDYLIVALQEDPSQERLNKFSPILSINNRKKALLSLRTVDKVITYQTEENLLNILKEENIEIRFLGDDYINSRFTGDFLPIEIKFIDRSHGWSTTKLREYIKNNF